MNTNKYIISLIQLSKTKTFPISLFDTLLRLTFPMKTILFIHISKIYYHKYTISGTALAIISLSAGLSGVLWMGKYIDKRGYYPIITILMSINLLSLCIAALLIYLNINVIYIYLCMLICGICSPYTSGIVRALWGQELKGTHLLKNAYAWECISDEAVFIIGSIIGTSFVYYTNPFFALTIIITSIMIGVIGMSYYRPKIHYKKEISSQNNNKSIIFSIPILIVFFLYGYCSLSGMTTTTIAYAINNGYKNISGLIMPFGAFTSLIVALLLLGSKISYNNIIKLLTTNIFVVLILNILLSTINNIFSLITIVTIYGLTTGLMHTLPYILLRNLYKNKLNTIFNWVLLSVSLGMSLGSFISSLIIDHYGTSISYLVMAVVTLITLITFISYKKIYYEPVIK